MLRATLDDNIARGGASAPSRLRAPVSARAPACGRARTRAWMGGAGRGELGAGGPGMRRFGASFIVQVRLDDGTLITFDARQPQESVAWPYQLLLSLAVLLAVVIGVTLLAVRWVTRPLNTLAAAADKASVKTSTARRSTSAGRSKSAAPRALSTRCSRSSRKFIATARAYLPRCRTT